MNGLLSIKEIAILIFEYNINLVIFNNNIYDYQSKIIFI